VRPDETDWQPHPVASGASLKLLYHDNQTGSYTALVRLAPATVFPARRHVAAEEMFLVSGVATIGSVEMRSGEYMRATEGSGHPEIRTASGCVFLVSGSEHDEMLAEDGG
jgi:ChrR Cupin-like domain